MGAADRYAAVFARTRRQRSLTALRAMSERCSGVSVFARAFAPSLPSATAAGFFFLDFTNGMVLSFLLCVKYSLDRRYTSA
jgi:hypothetical protein